MTVTTPVITDPVTLDTVLAALNALGPTADHVRARLVELGITGVRCHSAGCPVANFIRRSFDIPASIVPPISGYPGTVGLYSLRGKNQELLPEAVAQFASNFDAGLYPELEHQ
jgi:hypothetical protein